MRLPDVSLPDLPWPDLKTLYALPGGKRLISRGIGFIAPYSGSITASVEALADGYARLCLPDRRSNRNHLGSIHACALATLAETTAGLSILYSLPDGSRGIATHLGVDYHAKARGPIHAVVHWDVPAKGETADRDLEVVMQNQHGDMVSNAIVRYRIGPGRVR